MTVTIPRRFRRDLTVTATIPGRPGISSAEVSEWLAFEQIEGPMDERRVDYVSAQIVQAMVAIWATKKGKKPPSLDSLKIDFDPGRPKKSGLDMLRAVAAANAAAGGNDITASKLSTDDVTPLHEGSED